jgi:cysteine desulfurase
MIYLDYNATAPLRGGVLEAMLPYLRQATGNASSAHAAGRAARAAVERARRAIAAAIGAQPSEIVFTSGGTESNNLALLGTVPEPRGAHLVVSPIEHSSVLGPVRELERRGAQVTWLPVDGDGRVRPEDVSVALRPETALVSVGWANNEIGTVQPIAAIGAVCRARGVLLHVDAVQAFGKLPIDVGPLDLCALSAHKLGGPIGVGALFLRRGRRLRPLAFGGEQERGRRPGTENVAGVVGFAAALAAPRLGGTAERRERLWRAISSVAGVRRHSPAADSVPNTLNVGFSGVRGEALVAALDLEGVAVSVGSACAAGSGEPSHVLLATGRSAAEARGGVRFSLGPESTAEEIDAAAVAVRRVVERIRQIGRHTGTSGVCSGDDGGEAPTLTGADLEGAARSAGAGGEGARAGVV